MLIQGQELLEIEFFYQKSSIGELVDKSSDEVKLQSFARNEHWWLKVSETSIESSYFEIHLEYIEKSLLSGRIIKEVKDSIGMTLNEIPDKSYYPKLIDFLEYVTTGLNHSKDKKLKDVILNPSTDPENLFEVKGITDLLCRNVNIDSVAIRNELESILPEIVEILNKPTYNKKDRIYMGLTEEFGAADNQLDSILKYQVNSACRDCALPEPQKLNQGLFKICWLDQKTEEQVCLSRYVPTDEYTWTVYRSGKKYCIVSPLIEEMVAGILPYYTSDWQVTGELFTKERLANDVLQEMELQYRINKYLEDEKD
jgi:hypothetical protein